MTTLKIIGLATLAGLFFLRAAWVSWQIADERKARRLKRGK